MILIHERRERQFLTAQCFTLDGVPLAVTMDLTERKITKIAREASKLAVRTLKEDGIGTAEYDFIHLVRHHPGITQAEVREQLRVDKGAAARRAASLEAKGYLIRQANPKDGRSQLLFATEKAEGLAELQGAGGDHLL